MLSEDLLERLATRAADPTTRVDTPWPPRSEADFENARTVQIGLGVGPISQPAPLPPPATAADIAATEGRLGFELPAELKQLHGRIANGGFGPNGGLASLADTADRYLHLVAEPPGEHGQVWPKNLLPIDVTEPGANCLDLGDGQILYWDEESLADGPGDEVWQRSFRSEWASLDAWLEDWFTRPSIAAAMQTGADAAMAVGLKASSEYWRALGPAERADFSLPAEGWEQKLFGHLGIDLDNL